GKLSLDNICLEWHCGERSDEQRMPSGAKCSNPQCGIQHDRQWRELESQLRSMFSCTLKLVHHHPVPGLHEEHPTSVNHRTRKIAIGIVFSFRHIEGFRGQPAAQLRPWLCFPGEGPGGKRLVPAIHRQGAVGAGGSEEVSPEWVRGVAERSRVHE